MKALYCVPVTGDDRRWLRRSVTQVMTRPVVSVAVETSLRQATAVMLGAGIRHLVVTGDSGRCEGVLAARAITGAWATEPDLGLVAAGAVVERAAVVTDEATVGDAARVMRGHGGDAVAVVDGSGVAVGMFTSSDLIALLAG
ncbi:CBS domain-containing protein [Catellatospora sp. KI3]|uniref:CBS domain-containing protein n=1 Tax=Catellatospora sp. KI3 TaxID=3041620 RepID=UPI002482CE59|nr:CBS domain-containing protein [Catellatospora sp. KI3]MDI1464786.1 CBS domain-containing protein [Catellatospora sp. KI3]